MNFDVFFVLSHQLQFQSLSGLTLGLNDDLALLADNTVNVSIPFRADTGFEHGKKNTVHAELDVSIPFRADTGFERHGGRGVAHDLRVSIPFRADTGFERVRHIFAPRREKFQSLSGLTLGLNECVRHVIRLA